MKKSFIIPALLALVAVAPLIAETPNVSNVPGFQAPTIPPGPTPDITQALAFLIPDGSFETVPTTWTWTNSSGCGNMIGNWSGIFGVPALEGVNDYWAGGYCGGIPMTTSAQKTVTVPMGAKVYLFFGFFSWRPDPDDPAAPDFFNVKLGGNTVSQFAMTQAGDTYPNWVPRLIDVTSYQGQTVTLRFEGVSAGAQTGNVRVDVAAFITQNVLEVPTLSTYGLAGLALLLVAASIVFLRRRSA